MACGCAFFSSPKFTFLSKNTSISEDEAPVAFIRFCISSLASCFSLFYAVNSLWITAFLSLVPNLCSWFIRSFSSDGCCPALPGRSWKYTKCTTSSDNNGMNFCSCSLPSFHETPLNGDSVRAQVYIYCKFVRGAQCQGFFRSWKRFVRNRSEPQRNWGFQRKSPQPLWEV